MEKFYDHLTGLSLMATWCQANQAMGNFHHAFFGLEDQLAVALFPFADEEKYQALKRPDNLSPYYYLALAGTNAMQNSIRERAVTPGIDTRTTDHGYSVASDLNGPDEHLVELTYDTEEAVKHGDLTRDCATPELERWLTGDRRTNNNLREASEVPARHPMPR